MMDDRKTEYNTINELVKGNPAAFEQIFDNYYRKVYAFSLRNFRNKEDAEETVQDVFYNLWKERAKLKDIKDLEAWIFSICFNVIRKHFRRLDIERRHFKNIAESNANSYSSIEAELEYKDLLEITEQLIENLSPRQKTIFQLSRKESLSNLEIARKLNISVRTVDNHLSKAKAILKKAFHEGSILSSLFFYLFIK